MRNFLFLLIFSLLCAASARAWDDTGHKIITYIAWQNMTPAAREKAVATLTAAPEDSDILTLLASDSRSLAVRQKWMFVSAGYWADLMRDERFPNRRQKYHRGTWHYTDTFWRDVNGRVELVGDLKPDDENAVERLFALEKVLRDGGAQPAGDRAVALAWILHVAGDIHQPLHASARVTDAEPKGDQGGNTFLLSSADAPREQRDNLHWYWDSVITRKFPRVNDEFDNTYIPRLAAQIVKKHSPQKFAARLKPGKFDEWQQEGFAITTKELYPASLKRNVAPPEKYRDRAVSVAEEQLALAGYRMAELLNRVFAS